MGFGSSWRDGGDTEPEHGRLPEINSAGSLPLKTNRLVPVSNMTSQRAGLRLLSQNSIVTDVGALSLTWEFLVLLDPAYSVASSPLCWRVSGRQLTLAPATRR